MYTSKLRDSTGFPADRVYNPQNQSNTIIYAFIFEWEEDNLVYFRKVKADSKIS
jgi:hypothetical protein